MTTEAQKRAKKKYDSENMAFQTIKVNKAILLEFRQAVQDNGDKVNTVLREAMETYIKQHKKE